MELWRRSLGTAVRTGLFLLLTAFVTDAIAIMGEHLSDLIAVCLMFLFTLACFHTSTGEQSSGSHVDDHSHGYSGHARDYGRWLSIASLILFAASSALVLTQNGTAELLGLSLYVFGLEVIARRLSIVRSELPVLMVTLLLYAIFLISYDYIPQVSHALSDLSAAQSSVLERITGRDIALGPTYSGLFMVVLFAAFFSASFTIWHQRSPLRFLFALFSLVIFHAIYVVAWSFLVPSSWPSRLDFAQPVVSSFDFRPLLFLLLMVPTCLYLAKTGLAQPETEAHTRRRVWRPVTAAAVLTLFSALLVLQLPGASNSKSVMFYDDNYVNWEKPGFGQYGLEKTGMFGLFPSYLEAKGYSTVTGSDLTPESLDGIAVLVIINPPHSFTAQAKKAIWDFVGDGGALLALGDHTGQEVVRLPFNDLLQPANIAYNFDSAIPLNSQWEHTYELRPHQIMAGIDEDEIQIGVGASLEISPPSRPLVVSTNSFSDKGDPLGVQTGYLGNMTFTLDETLGDQVLVADCFHGKGKVLAFGDTSPFQNSALAHSHRFVDNVFGWLTTKHGPDLYPFNILASLALLAVALLLLLIPLEVRTAPLLTCTALLVLAASLLPPGSAINDQNGMTAKLVDIDVSHGERLSLDVHSEDSIDGFVVNSIRNGYMPMIEKQLTEDTIFASSILAVVAPTLSFSQREIRTIRSQVERGGLLLVTVGWKESEASRALLAEFGVSVSNVPLGMITAAQNPQDVSLWEAWPIATEESANAQVLVAARGYPVVVFVQCGQGGILAAGDSSFLLNKNLETTYAYNEPNILFLKDCFDRFGGGVAPND